MEKQEDDVKKILPFWDKKEVFVWAAITVLICAIALIYLAWDTYSTKNKQGVMNGWTQPSEAETEVHEIITPEEPVFETQDD